MIVMAFHTVYCIKMLLENCSLAQRRFYAPCEFTAPHIVSMAIDGAASRLIKKYSFASIQCAAIWLAEYNILWMEI